MTTIESPVFKNVEDSPGNIDPIKIYLWEIGQYPILKDETIRRLAQQIEDGADARHRLSVSYYSPDSPKQQTDINAINLGDQARQRLIETNLRLVVSVAKKYIGRGVPFLDLIQEGNIGLQVAAEKFDYRRGFKFSTYATWWIRQAVTRYLVDQRTDIRAPYHLEEKYKHLQNIWQTAEEIAGRSLPTQRVAAYILDSDTWINEAQSQRLSEEEIIVFIRTSLHNWKPPTDPTRRAAWIKKINDINTLKRVMEPPLSLDRVIGSEDELPLGQGLADGSEEGRVEETVMNRSLRDALKMTICTLSWKERRVMLLRFGLDEERTYSQSGDRPQTLEEIGKTIGVTRERVRQIELGAMRKLRHPSRAKRLKDYRR